MNLTPEFAVFLLFFLWLLVLSFLFFRFYFYYTKLIKNSKKDSIIQMLDDLHHEEQENKKTLEKLVAEYAKLEKEGLSHIQKVGLVRFNPFKDTGGDQSFILALIDAESTGVVISSLHTRTGTRWYAKGVVRGEGIEYALSEEEKKALKGAKFLSRSTEK